MEAMEALKQNGLIFQFHLISDRYLMLTAQIHFNGVAQPAAIVFHVCINGSNAVAASLPILPLELTHHSYFLICCSASSGH